MGRTKDYNYYSIMRFVLKLSLEGKDPITYQIGSPCFLSACLRIFHEYSCCMVCLIGYKPLATVTSTSFPIHFLIMGMNRS